MSEQNDRTDDELSVEELDEVAGGLSDSDISGPTINNSQCNQGCS